MNSLFEPLKIGDIELPNRIVMAPLTRCRASAGHVPNTLMAEYSAIAPEGYVSLLRPRREFVTPRALEIEEIPGIIEDYRTGAENAKRAGFDGVEIHSANGYLLDQFLQDSTNQRTDSYGGPVENRARLLLEVADAVISVCGAGRVGVHLAPRGDAHSMGDSNPLHTFSYVAEQLGQRAIAFIFTRESLGDYRISPILKKSFGGILIANEAFNRDTAQQVITAGEADAISFGKDFISNPDLVRRLQSNVTLNAYDTNTFYGYGLQDPKLGYTDYPFLES